MKIIVIVPGDNGPGFDMYSYLRNELGVMKLRGSVTEYEVPADGQLPTLDEIFPKEAH